MTITILGAGNLGTTLFYALSEHSAYDVRIWGRRPESVAHIKEHAIVGKNNLQELVDTSDVVIISISDDAINKFSQTFDASSDCIIAHTSGASSIDLIDNHKNIGIFYPLYSFPEPMDTLPSEVPFLIDAVEEKSLNILMDIAQSISEHVVRGNDKQRLNYHLAAVFANNFGNHMQAIAMEILNEQQLDNQVLLPIIHQSCEIWNKGLALESQSGPAVRDDKKTMKKHLELIKDSKSLSKLYRTISKSIFKFNKK